MLLCGLFLTATAQEIVIKDVKGPSNVCEIDLRDFMRSEQVSNGPLKARQNGLGGPVVNYKDRITNMPQCFHDFIDAFVSAGDDVLRGGSSWLSNPELGSRTSDGSVYYYCLKEETGSAPFTFPAGTTDGNVIREAATAAFIERYNAEYDVMQSFMPYACLAVNFDHPEIFWIGNSFRYGCGSSSSISYLPASGTGTVEYTRTLMLYLKARGFDIRCNGVAETPYNFRDETKIQNAVQNYNDIVHELRTEYEPLPTRYDKLVAVHDWLTTHNCYNAYYPTFTQSQIGDTPWSAYSGLAALPGQQAPVCEGYSRAFKVLCDSLEIPCILVSGIAKRENYEDHMWNYVQMDDGNWYAVDVTWDDPVVNNEYVVVSGHESHEWFLLGSATEVAGGLTFIESHPEQWISKYPNKGSQSWALLPGPELSETAWTSASVFTLTYIVDGEIYQTYEMEYGDPISPEPLPEKEGYTFSGWSEIPETMPDHDVTVTGTFTINTYPLIYIVDGSEFSRIDVEYGAEIVLLEEPEKEGYTFSGWSEVPTVMPAEEVIVIGTFTINSYVLTYMVDGDIYQTYILEYDTPITPEPNPEKEGYTFSGWSEIPENMPAHDVTVTGWFYKMVLGKCATPTISYVDGKLKFSCETEDVKYYSQIQDEDIRTYDTDEIDLCVTYTVTVYAARDDYDNSDPAVATLCWIEQQPATEGITDEDAVMELKALPVLIQTQGGTINIQGVKEGTPIAVYDIDGKKYGTAVADKDSATIPTTLRPGTVAIVKIGEKAIRVAIK